MQRRTDFRNIEDGQARRPRPAQLDARAGGWRVVELWRRRGTGTLPVRCEVYVAVSGRHGLYLGFWWHDPLLLSGKGIYCLHVI